MVSPRREKVQIQTKARASVKLFTSLLLSLELSLLRISKSRICCYWTGEKNKRHRRSPKDPKAPTGGERQLYGTLKTHEIAFVSFDESAAIRHVSCTSSKTTDVHTVIILYIWHSKNFTLYHLYLYNLECKDLGRTDVSRCSHYKQLICCDQSTFLLCPAVVF